MKYKRTGKSGYWQLPEVKFRFCAQSSRSTDVICDAAYSCFRPRVSSKAATSIAAGGRARWNEVPRWLHE